jgi:hypothetical protein
MDSLGPARGDRVSAAIRLEQRNRRSCLVLLVLLAGLTALIAWMNLGRFPSESVGDDVQADVAPGGSAGDPVPVAPAPQKSGS